LGSCAHLNVTISLVFAKDDDVLVTPFRSVVMLKHDDCRQLMQRTKSLPAGDFKWSLSTPHEAVLLIGRDLMEVRDDNHQEENKPCHSIA
jgi:hypothetical protein